MHPSLPRYPQQPLFHPPPEPQRTPFSHCAAAVGFWYLAAVIGFGVWELRHPSNDYRLVGVLVASAIVGLLTSTAMWGVLRASRTRIKPWALVLLALPFGSAIYTLISYLTVAVVVLSDR
jgi:ABC-type transport system involved in cytochrome c biogenesis permease subunit